MNASVTVHLRRLGCIAAVIALLAMLWTSFVPAVTADGPVTPTPPISIKNEPHVTQSNVRQGSFVALPPSPSSKNYNSKTASVQSTGTMRAVTPDPSSKNHGGDARSATALDDIKATASSVITCGASGNLDWTTTSNTFQVIRQCTLSVPQNGWVFISADSSVARQDGEFESQFEIDIDSTSGDANIDRWVNVYNDSGDGTDESAALSVLKQVTSGSHTFYFLGRRYSGAGTVLLYDPTLTVLVPSESGGKVFLPIILKQ
jgi:hypothetical protein